MHPLLVRNITFPLWQKRHGYKVLPYLQELEVSEWYTPGELKELQWEKLQALLRHCYRNVPYYRKVFDSLSLRPESFGKAEDLQQIPILEKDVLRRNIEQMKATDVKRAFGVQRSGGSTGDQLVLPSDRTALDYGEAAKCRARKWWGWNIGDRNAKFMGIPFIERNIKGTLREHLIRNKTNLRSYGLTEQVIRKYYKLLRRHRVRFVYGYPSALHAFAVSLGEEDLDPSKLGIKGICTTGEILGDSQRELLNRVFGCPVFDEYGCSEVTLIAHECPSGSMHIASENVFAEFISPNDSLGSDQLKDIVITDLNNYYLPLLRYRVGDKGNESEQMCSCGRGLPLMENVVGRQTDMVVLESGELAHPMFLEEIIGGLTRKGVRIRQFRVIQKSRKDFLALLAVEEGEEPAIVDFFLAGLRKHVGRDVDVNFRFVDSIPRETSGKLRFFVSEISKNRQE
jgi:phenylacetate-CoA ligase